MSSSTPHEPLEAFPLPDGAIELDEALAGLGTRAMAVAALQLAMRERRLTLPLGPQTTLIDEQRLLSLNRFAVQLSLAGVLADQLAVDLTPWATASSAPQLLLAALVDEENGVVVFPGVLTGSELLALANQSARNGDALLLNAQAFHGGVDRLLSLVQLLEPEALPRLALMAPAAAVAVIDWLRGQLDGALSALGGELTPVTAGAFRGGSAPSQTRDQALAMLVIPFGLAGEQLVSGDAARRCVRQFQLALIPTGPEQPTALVVRLSSAVAGALLPDGLELETRQGSHLQSIRSAMNTELELVFQAGDPLIDVGLRYGAGDPVQLPTLQLPAG